MQYPRVDVEEVLVDVMEILAKTEERLKELETRQFIHLQNCPVCSKALEAHESVKN